MVHSSFSAKSGVNVKFLGMRAGPTKCQCSYCIGKNDSTSCRRALRKRGRQHEKKEVKKQAKLSEPLDN
jgi:hypothetical protein